MPQTNSPVKFILQEEFTNPGHAQYKVGDEIPFDYYRALSGEDRKKVAVVNSNTDYEQSKSKKVKSESKDKTVKTADNNNSREGQE